MALDESSPTHTCNTVCEAAAKLDRDARIHESLIGAASALLNTLAESPGRDSDAATAAADYLKSMWTAHRPGLTASSLGEVGSLKDLRFGR